MSTDDFQRILKERACNCDLPELEKLLARYGHDDTSLASIKRGVYDRLNREDSGDWTSSASSGWKSANDKKKALEQFILDRGPAGAFNAAANGNSDTIARLQQQVQQMESRLRKLEQRDDARKFKL